ncbi:MULTISPECIES: hypothetical protein [unclassified Mesorhizobium]|uniref:hypothetical protein n=1 Tax=unclassified Mesorhizobium TaxID=325217 RepID=UPI0033385528
MAWSDLLLFAPGILGVAAMGLAKLPDLIDAITGDDQAPFDRFDSEARNRGLDYAGMTKKWDVRTVFAQLRTDASNAVAADVENWAPVMNDSMNSALKANPQRAHEVRGMLAGLSYSHILYEHEARAVAARASDSLQNQRSTRPQRVDIECPEKEPKGAIW